MFKYLTLLATWLLLSGTGFIANAQGLDKRSTIILERQLQKIRITALLSKNLLPPSSELLSDQEQIQSVFEKAIEPQVINLGGKACEWGNPSGHVSDSAYYIQALSFCFEDTQSSKISWDLKFLKGFPEDHYVLVNIMVGDHIEQLVVTSKNTRINYHPVPINQAFIEGLSYIGFDPDAWSDVYGNLAAPLGLWLLFFCLYLSISEQTIVKSRKLLTYYTAFLSTALLCSFLYQWQFSEGLATWVILVSMLAYFVIHWPIKYLKVRLLLVSIVASIHGIAGLSLLPIVSDYVGTTSLFASFQVGAILGIWGGIMLLLPCMRWLNHALPFQSSVNKALQVTMILASAFALFI